MPDVAMPDGAVVRFPDDMGKDQIRSLIASKYPDLGQPAAPQKSMIDMVAEKLPGADALGEVLKFGSALGQNIKGGFQEGVGGLKQTYGELGWLGRAITNPAPILTEGGKSLMPTSGEIKAGQEGKTLAEQGAALSQEARKPWADNLAAQITFDVTGSIAQTSPALVAGLITKSPAVGLGAFAPGVWGQTYAESRQGGKDPLTAAQEARFKTGTEVTTEMIPLGWILKAGKPLLKRVLDATVGEGMQEGFNEFVNAGYDAGLFDDKTPAINRPVAVACQPGDV